MFTFQDIYYEDRIKQYSNATIVASNIEGDNEPPPHIRIMELIGNHEASIIIFTLLLGYRFNKGKPIYKVGKGD